MSDTAVANGSKQATNELSDAQYKEMCKMVRQHQLKNGKAKKRSKPILKPIGQTEVVPKNIVIQQNPVDWDDIPNGAPFALDPKGVLVYTKAGASRALCLNTMQPVPVGGASVYRVFL
jgi:hypothetical protein